MGDIGPAARDAIPALVAALASSYSSGYNLSGRASDALVRIGADAVPALIEFVKSPKNRWFIREGIWTLGKIGPAAKEAVPVIAPYLRSDNSQIRYAAAEALGNIGPAAGAAVPALRLALNDEDSLLRLEAAEALKKIEGS